MSVSATSSLSAPTANASPNFHRRSANYHPSVWGDHFIQYLSGSTFEQKRGHVASAVQCYMKQHGVTKQHTIDEFRRQITNAWKDINEECLDPTNIPKPLIMRVLNLTRVIDVLYTDKDGYTHSKGSTKKDIEALLLNPCPI